MVVSSIIDCVDRDSFLNCYRHYTLLLQACYKCLIHKRDRVFVGNIEAPNDSNVEGLHSHSESRSNLGVWQAKEACHSNIQIVGP